MANYKVVGVGEHQKYFDENSYHDVIDYIFNHATYIDGAGIDSLETAADEMLNTAIHFDKNSGKRLRHSVLSFADWEVVTPEMADAFAREIIQHYAPEYQIVYAVHTNQDNLHIHFVMNQISYVDGHRYRGQKQDYRAFEKHMRNLSHHAADGRKTAQ